MKISSIKEWRKVWGAPAKQFKVGDTVRSDTEVSTRGQFSHPDAPILEPSQARSQPTLTIVPAKIVWGYFLEERYNAFRRNCQNFASLLFALIRHTDHDRGTSKYKEEWDRFPSPIGRHFLPDVRAIVQPILQAIDLHDASARIIPLYISRSYLRKVEQMFGEYGVFSPRDYEKAKKEGRRALKEAKKRSNIFRQALAKLR